MYLTADGRRPFARPTWPAKTCKPSGKGRAAAPGDVLDELRLVPHREARASFSSGSPELKINVCAGLRVSAAENEFNRRLTPTFVRPTWPTKNAKPSGLK
jgi:hypothetical protein